MRLRDPEARAQQRLRRDSAQADNQSRTNCFQLSIQPRPACADLPHTRLLVDANLAARLPSKMLDGVGHIDFAPVDLRLFQAFV